jgi:hypothetical protein
VEVLAARKGEQPLGQSGSTLGADRGTFYEARGFFFVAASPAQEIEIAHNGHEQIVEIVRNTAGELADHFHFLRLPQ